MGTYLPSTQMSLPDSFLLRDSEDHFDSGLVGFPSAENLKIIEI